MTDTVENLKEGLLNLLGVIAGIAWVFSGLIGAIYWAAKDDLLGVVLSLFIPLYGVLSTIIDVLS